MDIKHFLTSCIALLYLSNNVSASEFESASQIAKESLIVTKHKALNLDVGSDTITELKNVITWQLNIKDYDKSLLDSQLKLKLKDDVDTIEAINSILTVSDEKSLFKRLKGLKTTCSLYKNKLELLNVMDSSRFAYRMNDIGSDKEDGILEELEHKIHSVRKGIGNSASYIGSVGFIDRSQIRDTLVKGNKEYSLEGILTFGLQGWNNLYGDHQGQRRGETLLLSAMGHSYKSGRLMNAFAEVIEFNKPTYILDSTLKLPPEQRKACAIHITIENNYLGDTQQLLKYYKEQETKEAFSIIGMTDEQLDEYSEYLESKLAKKDGIHGFIEQHDASTFTYEDYFDIIAKYQAMGYEVHFVSLDYAGRMSTRGCIASSGSGSEKRDLVKRLQAHALKHKYALMTAWQMSSDAQTKLREGEQFLVKVVKELGYYLDCRTVHNEVDMEVYQAFVIVGDKKYITWQRGKHRKPGNQPEEKMKFCVYRTNPVGFVQWDYGLAPTFTHRLDNNFTNMNSNEFFD